VLGWGNHEALWRSDRPDANEVPAREAAVQAFYSRGDEETAVQILRLYGVTHVVLGDLERQAGPGAARLAGLPFLKPVLQGDTAVYEVLPILGSAP
jgi:uncharacterized membrane protein